MIRASEEDNTEPDRWRAVKRSGRWARVSLVEDAAQASPRDVDVRDLDSALDELAAG